MSYFMEAPFYPDCRVHSTLTGHSFGVLEMVIKEQLHSVSMFLNDLRMHLAHNITLFLERNIILTFLIVSSPSDIFYLHNHNPFIQAKSTAVSTCIVCSPTPER